MATLSANTMDNQVVYKSNVETEDIWGKLRWVNTKENQEENIQFKCSKCKKKFHGQERLKVHMLFHTGEKLFPCRVCKKKFPAMVDLIYHNKTTHIGEKNRKSPHPHLKRLSRTHLKRGAKRQSQNTKKWWVKMR